jgi:hypothetical protein
MATTIIDEKAVARIIEVAVPAISRPAAVIIAVGPVIIGAAIIAAAGIAVARAITIVDAAAERESTCQSKCRRESPPFGGLLAFQFHRSISRTTKAAAEDATIS